MSVNWNNLSTVQQNQFLQATGLDALPEAALNPAQLSLLAGIVGQENAASILRDVRQDSVAAPNLLGMPELSDWSDIMAKVAMVLDKGAQLAALSPQEISKRSEDSAPSKFMNVMNILGVCMTLAQALGGLDQVGGKGGFDISGLTANGKPGGANFFGPIDPSLFLDGGKGVKIDGRELQVGEDLFGAAPKKHSTLLQHMIWVLARVGSVLVGIAAAAALLQHIIPAIKEAWNGSTSIMDFINKMSSVMQDPTVQKLFSMLSISFMISSYMSQVGKTEFIHQLWELAEKLMKPDQSLEVTISRMLDKLVALGIIPAEKGPEFLQFILSIAPFLGYLLSPREEPKPVPIFTPKTGDPTPSTRAADQNSNGVDRSMELDSIMLDFLTWLNGIISDVREGDEDDQVYGALERFKGMAADMSSPKQSIMNSRGM